MAAHSFGTNERSRMAENNPKIADNSMIPALCRMQKKRALLVGDIMLDRYVDGVVNRISPEAPVPILNRSRTHQVAGGAANVAHNLANMGLEVSLIGLIGADDGGADLLDQLKTIPQLTTDCLSVEGRPTTQKTRFRAQGQQILRVDEEVSYPLSVDAEQALFQKIEAGLAQSPDILILSDYSKGCLSDWVVAQTINAAKKTDISIIVDPKSTHFSKYAGATILTPNLAELSAASGKSLSSHDEIETVARTHLEKAHLGAMLVTLGGGGMMYVDRASARHLAATALDVFDVSGAGDTVVAAMAAAFAAGDSWQTGMDLATQAAGIVVGKSGTATVTPGEILAQIPSETPFYKMSDLDALKTASDSWAQDGAIVGFTNGCFDLLHPGHLDLLNQASQTCDKLIVGVNSDTSVKLLKGPSRPSQNEQLRASIVAQLPFVDAVIIFDEETPANLINALLPKRLIKGGDYEAEEIVGYHTVTDNGGTVHIIPLHRGHSTSRLLNT